MASSWDSLSAWMPPASTDAVRHRLVDAEAPSWPEPIGRAASSATAPPLPPDAVGPESREMLRGLIERDIIPRLFLAHRRPEHALFADDGEAGPDTGAGDLAGELDALTALSLDGEADAILAEVDALLARGVALRAVYLDVLAPVARRLGDMWLADTCTFTEVTIGLSRLHRVVCELSRRDVPAAPARSGHGGQPSVYLAPVPGEQHTLGLAMVEAMFLEAGWQTVREPTIRGDRILAAVRRQRFDVIGFSVGCAEMFDQLTGFLGDVRRASANRDVRILVGGRYLVDHPEMGVRLEGADCVTANDGVVEFAERLLAWSPDRSGPALPT